MDVQHFVKESWPRSLHILHVRLAKRPLMISTLNGDRASTSLPKVLALQLMVKVNVTTRVLDGLQLCGHLSRGNSTSDVGHFSYRGTTTTLSFRQLSLMTKTYC